MLKPIPPLPPPLRKRPGAWKRGPTVAPLKSEVPSKPSGNLERWLVGHGRTYGVLTVVWDMDWFQARERAERDGEKVYVVRFPVSPEEEATNRMSAAMIAACMGWKLHVDIEREELTELDRQMKAVYSPTPVICWEQCPERHTFKNGTVSRCVYAAGHAGEHRGWRKHWLNGKGA